MGQPGEGDPGGGGGGLVSERGCTGASHSDPETSMSYVFLPPRPPTPIPIWSYVFASSAQMGRETKTEQGRLQPTVEFSPPLIQC